MWYVGGVDRVENEARSLWKIVGIGDPERYSRSLVLALCAAEPLTHRCAFAEERTGGAAAGHPEIVAIALVAERTGDDITMPCGACCQVALELGGPDVLVGAADPKGAVARSTISDLLPEGPHKALCALLIRPVRVRTAWQLIQGSGPDLAPRLRNVHIGRSRRRACASAFGMVADFELET